MIAALAALVVLYSAGYVAGALLLPPPEPRVSASLGMVRLVAGLFVTSTGILLSLAVGISWFVGPLAGVLLALVLYRGRALTLPSPPRWTGWSGTAALLVAAVLVAPFMIALLRMAQGAYPPVFYNVDSAYFLEKVHALLHTDRLPPPSLSVLGGKFSYHYGVQGIAAVIARSTGLLPHQATFAVTLPLLVLGSVAAAIVAAEVLSPSIPAALSVPLLLIVSPTLWHPFWQQLVAVFRDASAAGSTLPLRDVAGDYELWGLAALTGQNLATHFLVLAVVGGIAAAGTRGWRLPVFLVGSAVLFKAPTGVALMGGFAAMLAWRGIRSRSSGPFLILGAAVGLFGVVYSALWILPRLPQSYMTELYPLFHVRWLREQGRFGGFLLDLLWLAAPALPLFLAVRKARHDRDPVDPTPWQIAILAITPLIIVNTLRGVDLRPGRGIDYDWFQIVLPVPILAHAAVLAWAGQGWPASRTRRLAAVSLLVLAIAAPVGVAAHYAVRLAATPSAGHEFVDNRAIAEALQAIPVSGSVIVTNDLRYPAEGFSRDYRQMQIPALFGHQGFAVNYAYEAYDFSRDRLALQRLLTASELAPEIDVAAQRYGWTHLLIRKDYPHPANIQLTRIFDSEQYAVYQFRAPTGRDAEAQSDLTPRRDDRKVN